MRAWDEVWAFARGTRPPAPPGPAAPLASLLMVTAGVAHLPLVYLLLRDVAPMPAFVLGVGLLGMGLAWAGGVSLEGRRHGTARAFCALGIAAGVLAFAPALAGPLGGARFVFLAIAALSAGGIVALARAQGLNRSSS